MARKRRKVAYRKTHENRMSTVLIIAVLLLMSAVVGVGSIRLKIQKDEYAAKEQYYMELISQEEARAEELAEFEKYTKTNKYIEEVAKQKLGLVKDGEIVFMADK